MRELQISVLQQQLKTAEQQHRAATVLEKTAEQQYRAAAALEMASNAVTKLLSTPKEEADAFAGLLASQLNN